MDTKNNAYLDIFKDEGLREIISRYGLTDDDVNILVMVGTQMLIVKASDGGLDVVLNPNGTINRVTVNACLLDKIRGDRLQKVGK